MVQLLKDYGAKYCVTLLDFETVKVKLCYMEKDRLVEKYHELEEISDILEAKCSAVNSTCM